MTMREKPVTDQRGEHRAGRGTNRSWIDPLDLDEALAVRAELSARPLAGATDLYVRHRAEAGALPRFDGIPILYVGHLKELTAIDLEEDGAYLRIGAAAVYTDIATHPACPEVLLRAIAELAAPALRNTGTLGGNIGNASPAADAVCALYALHAEVELASLRERRHVSIGDLITGPGRTTIRDDELIASIKVPARISDTAEKRELTYYRKVGTRRANALSKVAFAACVTITGSGGTGGTLSSFGLAIGAVGPTVVTSPELETLLHGVDAARYDALRPRLIAGYQDLINPISDQRSTETYRRRVTHNLVHDLFDRALPAALREST